MKNLSFCALLLAAFLISSCASWTRIGTLTMMSTRNIDSKQEYTELARYIDSESKGARASIKKTNSGSEHGLELAMDRCVATIPGGEFMRNVQIYVKGSEVKVVGDVWGKSSGYGLTPEQAKVQEKKTNLEVQADQFSVGDSVLWNDFGNYRKCLVIGKDQFYAAIKYLDNRSVEKMKKVKYQYLTKLGK